MFCSVQDNQKRIQAWEHWALHKQVINLSFDKQEACAAIKGPVRCAALSSCLWELRRKAFWTSCSCLIDSVLRPVSTPSQRTSLLKIKAQAGFSVPFWQKSFHACRVIKVLVSCVYVAVEIQVYDYTRASGLIRRGWCHGFKVSTGFFCFPCFGQSSFKLWTKSRWSFLPPCFMLS